MRMPLELAGERYPNSTIKAVAERFGLIKSAPKSDPNPYIGERSDRGLLVTHAAKREMAEMKPLQKRAQLAKAEIAAFERAAKRQNSRALLSSLIK